MIVTSSGAVSKTSHPGFREWIKKRSNTDVIVVENRPIAKNKITHLPEKFTIGYFGKIREAKMFKILLKAVEKWEQPNQPSIIIAGHGTAEEEVIQMLSNSSIDVEFNGKFTQDELPKLIERISVMYAVYPVTRGNILEGAIPTKMFDAAAEGRPSVVNNKCLMGDIAIAENIGYPISSNNFIELLDTLTTIKEGGIQVKLERDWNWDRQRGQKSWRVVCRPRKSRC